MSDSDERSRNYWRRIMSSLGSRQNQVVDCPAAEECTEENPWRIDEVSYFGTEAAAAAADLTAREPRRTSITSGLRAHGSADDLASRLRAHLMQRESPQQAQGRIYPSVDDVSFRGLGTQEHTVRLEIPLGTGMDANHYIARRYPALGRDLAYLADIVSLRHVREGLCEVVSSVPVTLDDGVDVRALSLARNRARAEQVAQVSIPFGELPNREHSLNEVLARVPEHWARAAMAFPGAFLIETDRDPRYMCTSVRVRSRAYLHIPVSERRMEQEQHVAMLLQQGSRMPHTVSPAEHVASAFASLGEAALRTGNSPWPLSRYRSDSPFATALQEEHETTVPSITEQFTPQSGPRKVKLKNPRGSKDVTHSHDQGNQNSVHRRIARRRSRDERNGD